MPYVYVPDSTGQTGAYPSPVPDRTANMRGNGQAQNGMQWGVPQPQMPAPVPQANSGNIIWVQGEAGAKAYLVAPGNTVPLWDSESQTIYLKSVDVSGMPSMRVLDYIERNMAQPQRQQQDPQIDMSKYITIEAAEEIIDRRVNDILTERMKRSSKAGTKKEEAENG